MAVAADSWREFRGPNGVGVVLDAQLPTRWSESENVAWKTPIHGRGWSSPVIDGGEVWLTTATEDGLKMFVVCVDLDNGAVKHDQLLFENETVQPDYHVTNSYASPSPVIDGPHVFVTFGAYGTACLDRQTCEVLWERRDLPCNHFRGAGSSPILYRDLLIFNMDGFDHQYAVALNRQTGETVWKAEREIDYGSDDGDVYKAFSTPTVIEVAGQPQLISLASMACLALDPMTGKELWRVRYSEHSTTTRPIFDGKRIYFSTGFSKAGLMAVRVDGQGDVTDTHVDWIQYKGIGAKPSPVLVNGRLFDVTDDGILNRIDLETGEIVWKTRLGGKFSASLVANENYLFAFDHDQKGYVFSVADEPQLVADNSLADGCNATPAIVDDSLIVRTTTHLYRLTEKP
jgi:outer membrane protein assembly factor BamB